MSLISLFCLLVMGCYAWTVIAGRPVRHRVAVWLETQPIKGDQRRL